MYFNLESLFQRFLRITIIITTLIVAMFAVGDSVIFERAILFILVACLLLCIRNINNLGVVLALLASRVAEELTWQALPFFTNFYVKLVVYGLVGYGYWWFRSDYRNNLIVSIVFTVSVLAELYWFITDYSAPDIVWFVLLILNALFVRWMLFMRFTYTEKWFPRKAQLTILEWQVYVLFQIFIYLNVAVIGEYILRHVFALPLNYVYGIYPYIVHLLLIYLIWLILCSSARSKHKNVMDA